MNAKRRDVGASQMNQVCKVCGEPAAGFHFGAFTCEGCKVSDLLNHRLSLLPYRPSLVYDNLKSFRIKGTWTFRTRENKNYFNWLRT
ncbi:hypothetical protein K0M31_004413 [Melipona bicolor]|uniref:Nuclear receptor domain-containing protein n=1 Tax=Melipona bicolor TaxID=60889 RepID=A0AA40FXD2_9HYME|nr:hypothetical protein K0M31_004413 [Melipona bicolor]